MSQNRSQWVLPLDSYEFVDIPLELYAVRTLQISCLERQGVADYHLYSMDVNGPRGTATNSVGRSLFDVSIAQRLGYRSEMDPRVDRAASIRLIEEWNSISDSSFKEMLGQCTDDAEDRLSSGASGVRYAMGLANEANVQVTSSDKYRALLPKWKECMAPQGIPDLPDDPLEMPSAWMIETYGFPVDYESEGTALSQEEIAIAVADAQCRESSGFAEGFYQLEWDAQMELVKQHQSELDQALQDVTAYKENVLSIISGTS